MPRLMPRGDSLARQLQLLQLLDERRSVAVAEVAGELGYTSRTVYRDLVVLERVGVPIYREADGRRARWRVVDGYKRKLAVTLSFSEMLALTAGRHLLSGLTGTLFHEAAVTGLEKIRAALPAPLATRAEAAAPRFSASGHGGRDYSRKRLVVERLVDALERHETVRLRYRKPGHPRAEERRVDPYHLHLHAGGLYVLGWCHRSRGVRTFLVDRADEVVSTGEPFEVREAVSLGNLVHGAFGPWSGPSERVALRFGRRVARFVAERQVHSSQVSQWRSDGALDVTLQAPLSPALEAWLLGFGADVEVRAPAKLAARLRDEHARAARPAKRNGNL